MSRTRPSPRVTWWWPTGGSRRARPAFAGSFTSAEDCSTTTRGTPHIGASPSSCSSGRSRSLRLQRRKRSRRRRRRRRPRPRPRRRLLASRTLGFADRFDKPNRYTGRLQRARVGAGVAGRSLGDQLAVALDPIVEPEARPANVAAAREDHEPVVEAGWGSEADVCAERQSLDPLGLQLRVAAAKAREVLDPRYLEPDEIDGVMRDALRVRLGEANLHLGREAEVHG